MPVVITQDDIDDALSGWNGDPDSIRRVSDYMKANGRSREAAAFLQSEYGKAEFTVVKDGAEPLTLPWHKVQRGIAQLIAADAFITPDTPVATVAETVEPEPVITPSEPAAVAEPERTSPHPVFLADNSAVYDLDFSLYSDGDILGYDQNGVEYSIMQMGEHDFINTTTRMTSWGDILGAADIPADIQAAMCDFRPKSGIQDQPATPAQRALDFKPRNKKRLDEAARMILDARRPLVMVGGGAKNADLQVKRFVETLGAPACETLMGRSTLPGSHPLYIGNVGMHGLVLSNIAVMNADLIIALGTRFSDRINGGQRSYNPRARILHIDIDRAEIDKNMPSDHYLVGDIAVALEALTPLIIGADSENNARWLKQLDAPKSPVVDARAWSPENIIKTLHNKVGEDALIATDVGQHQMWTSLYYSFEKPRSFITSGGLGTMGFGLGAAIGAKIGAPDKTVALVTGDGCFRMNLNELAMAAAYGVKVIVLLMNNSVLGMVRQWQTLIFGGRYSQTVLDRPPDFVKIAEAYGLAGFRADDLHQLETALDAALLADTTTVIDCTIDKDEMVRPMAKPGAPIDDFLLD